MSQEGIYEAASILCRYAYETFILHFLYINFQFVKTRGEDVTEQVIRKATIGMKEIDSTVYSVLNNLFSPLSKKRAREMGLTEEEEARYVGRLSHEVGGAGKDAAIASGNEQFFCQKGMTLMLAYVQVVLGTMPPDAAMMQISPGMRKAFLG